MLKRRRRKDLMGVFSAEEKKKSGRTIKGVGKVEVVSCCAQKRLFPWQEKEKELLKEKGFESEACKPFWEGVRRLFMAEEKNLPFAAGEERREKRAKKHHQTGETRSPLTARRKKRPQAFSGGEGAVFPLRGGEVFSCESGKKKRRVSDCQSLRKRETITHPVGTGGRFPSLREDTGLYTCEGVKGEGS